MSEPKVTECWAKEGWTPADRVFTGHPMLLCIAHDQFTSNHRPAILMWKEDYDAMRKELEELRKELRIKALNEMVAISQEIGDYDRD